MATNEPKTHGPENRQGLYAYVASFTREAIDSLVEIMRTSRNESLKMGASKVLLDKAIPDLKAMELGGPNGQPIQLFINADKGFIPATGQIATASVGGTEWGLASIQGVGMAPQSTENDNSNNGAGQAGTP